MRRRELFGTAAAGLFAPSVLRAEAAWPERPLRLIVPFPPGGSNDTIARLMQPKLQRPARQAGGGREPRRRLRLGGRDRDGARRAGRLLVDAGAGHRGDQPDDDAPALPPHAGLRPGEPGGHRAASPSSPTRARPGAPSRTWSRRRRRRRTPISYATLGIGSLPHVSTTLLQQLGDFKLTHVPYRGGAPAVQAVLAGEVPLIMSNIVVTSQHIKAGTLRPLGRHPPGRNPPPAGREELRAAGLRGFRGERPGGPFSAARARRSRSSAG